MSNLNSQGELQDKALDEEEIKSNCSQEEETVAPDGETETYDLLAQKCERENELACRLDNVNEKLQEEIQHRKALEEIILDMRKSWEDQREILIDKVAAIETKPGKSQHRQSA